MIKMEASDTEDLVIDDDDHDINDDDGGGGSSSSNHKYNIIDSPYPSHHHNQHHQIMNNNQQDVPQNLKRAPNTKRGRKVTVVRTFLITVQYHVSLYNCLALDNFLIAFAIFFFQMYSFY